MRDKYEGESTKLTSGLAESNFPNGSIVTVPRVAVSSIEMTPMAMVFSPLWLSIPSGT